MRLIRDFVYGRGMTALSLSLFVLALLASGCVSEEDACDPGMELIDGNCVPVNDDDGGTQDDGGNGTDVDLPAGMGDACTTSDECSLDADYCAFNPMAGTGYCTLQDCTTEPDDCPEGHCCFDFSIFGPDYPTACLTDEDCAAMGG
jgi:hypothetical protein